MSMVIIGAGGHAREVLDILNAEVDPHEQPIGFLVEPRYGDVGTLVHGLPILGGLDWLANQSTANAICGVGLPEVRHRLVKLASAYGVTFGNAIHPTVVQTPWVTIGAGVVIAAGSILTNEVVLEDHVHINLACTISHDSRLREFVTLSPGVHLAGGVTVGAGAFLGTGAAVLPRISVGAWSIVGAGAVVTEDVPPNSTVIGVPATLVASREPGWHENP